MFDGEPKVIVNFFVNRLEQQCVEVIVVTRMRVRLSLIVH